jgi:hypothetical protein
MRLVRSRLHAILHALAILVLCAAGCDGGKKPFRGARDEEEPAKTRSDEPLTDEECQQFAAKFVEAVRAGDAEAVNGFIDWPKFMERGTREIDLPDFLRRDLIRRYGTPVGRKGGIGRLIVNSIGNGGSYKHLRTHGTKVEPRVLFRALPAGGVTYHDGLLARGADGRVKFIDLYLYHTGELLSLTAQRLLLPDAIRANPDGLNHLNGLWRELAANESKMVRMTKNINGGRPEDALKAYAELPDLLMHDKNALLMRLVAAKQIGGQTYIDAMEALRTHYPADPCLDILSIDYHVQKGEYTKALEMVSRLETEVGGDPYLHAVRANIHFEAGDLAAARRAANKAIEEEPTLRQPHERLLVIALQEKNFDETLRLLRKLSDEFKLGFPDLTTVPDYADFVKSPRYQEWLKSHPVKKP